MAHSEAETVDVNGHEATVLTLTDEGRAYGFAVGWQQAPGRRIVVEGLDELRAGTRWWRSPATCDPSTRRSGTGCAGRCRSTRGSARSDPDATPVEVTSGTIDGDTWTLTALVPSGYPLGPEDQRRDCYRLTFRGESSGDKCDDHPWWMRIGGQLFVFGPADPDTSEVTIGPYRDLPDEPFTVPTATIDQGPPTAFYVAPLPDGRCYVTITPASDPNLGDMGAGPGDPEQAACLEQLNGSPAVPIGVGRIWRGHGLVTCSRSWLPGDGTRRHRGEPS